MWALKKDGRGHRSGWVPLLLPALLLCACELHAPTEGPRVPDVSGLWSGTYRVTGCALSGADDPFFCAELFQPGAALVLDLSLDQAGADLQGLMAQGELTGFVDGRIESDGVMTLRGELGGPDAVATTTIVAWQTGLVGDTLVGSWRFETVDNTGSGFGRATVDATLEVFGRGVPTFFGCLLEDTLEADVRVEESLSADDCQHPADGSFFDPYPLRLRANEPVTVTLRSAEFDAFLQLAVGDELLAEADDIAEDTTDARVEIVSETDLDLVLVANSFAPGEAGAYALTVEASRATATFVQPSELDGIPGGVGKSRVRVQMKERGDALPGLLEPDSEEQRIVRAIRVPLSGR